VDISTSDCTDVCTDVCRAALGKRFGSCFRLRQGTPGVPLGANYSAAQGVGARPTVAKQRVCDFHFQPLVLDRPSRRKQQWLAFLFPWGTGASAPLLSGVRGTIPRPENEEGQSHSRDGLLWGKRDSRCLWLASVIPFFDLVA
jgi:hypothetical protein